MPDETEHDEAQTTQEEETQEKAIPVATTAALSDEEETPKHEVVVTDGALPGLDINPLDITDSSTVTIPQVPGEVSQGLPAPIEIPGLAPGRIVMYVMPNEEVRPAMIVRVWKGYNPVGSCNMVVQLDGDNDIRLNAMPCPVHGYQMWATSVPYDDSEQPKPHSWHFPVKV